MLSLKMPIKRKMYRFNLNDDKQSVIDRLTVELKEDLNSLGITATRWENQIDNCDHIIIVSAVY